MKMVTKTVLLSAAALLTVAAGSASAQTYANASGSTVRNFGAGNSPIYGQVFTAPGGTLSSFTFYNDSRDSAGERFGIAAWNGTTVVGPDLFSSDSNVVLPDAAGGFFSHAISSINLKLTTGLSYYAYFTTTGVASPVSNLMFEGSSTSPLGGGFRYSNNNAAAAGNSYSSFGVPDLRYTAVFTPNIAAAAPEPATWAMMILGFGIAGVAMRRRHKTNVRVSYAA